MEVWTSLAGLGARISLERLQSAEAAPCYGEPAGRRTPACVPVGWRHVEGYLRRGCQTGRTTYGDYGLPVARHPALRRCEDGGSQRIHQHGFTAEEARRSVAVPSGSHRVAFESRPESVRQGMMLTTVGLVLLVGAALLLVLWGRRVTRAIVPGGTGS